MPGSPPGRGTLQVFVVSLSPAEHVAHGGRDFCPVCLFRRHSIMSTARTQTRTNPGLPAERVSHQRLSSQPDWTPPRSPKHTGACPSCSSTGRCPCSPSRAPGAGLPTHGLVKCCLPREVFTYPQGHRDPSPPPHSQTTVSAPLLGPHQTYLCSGHPPPPPAPSLERFMERPEGP